MGRGTVLVEGVKIEAVERGTLAMGLPAEPA